MILKLLVALLPVLIVLLISEYLWRHKTIKGEIARKFIHILAGMWMAFWPLYIPFDGIFILGCVALVLLIYSRVTRLFHAIYAVKRRTYGDIFYALALILCAYFGTEPWIFTVSILLLALADGGAAVVGKLWGSTNQYYMFGSRHLRKSVVGTITFIGLTYVSLGIAWCIGGSETMQMHMVAVFIILPIIATIAENSMPFGLDNVATPLVATLVLNSLV
jgi:phytol kinase